MKSLNIIFISLIIHSSLFAQNDSIQRIGINLSYFGESMTHPGYRFGAEYQLSGKVSTRTKRNGITINRKYELLLKGNLGNYYHFRNHTGLLLDADVGFRYIRKKGFKYEASLGVGYLHTFLQGDAYAVTDYSEVEKVPLAGQSNFSCLISWGIGRDYSFKYGKPWAWHIRNVLFMQYPFGSRCLWHSALELGVTYYLNIPENK